MSVLAVSWVPLSVQEPLWNVVVRWSSNDITDLLDFIVSDFSSSLAGIDLSNLEGEERKLNWGVNFIRKSLYKYSIYKLGGFRTRFEGLGQLPWSLEQLANLGICL